MSTLPALTFLYAMGLRSRTTPHSHPKADYPAHKPEQPPPPPPPPRSKLRHPPGRSVLDAWKSSRAATDAAGAPTTLPAGAARPFTIQNIRTALWMAQVSVYGILQMFFSIHPYRITLLLIINIIRGLLPAFRSYSHALILDEVRVFVCIHPTPHTDHALLHRSSEL